MQIVAADPYIPIIDVSSKFSRRSTRRTHPRHVSQSRSYVTRSRCVQNRRVMHEGNRGDRRGYFCTRRHENRVGERLLNGRQKRPGDSSLGLGHSVHVNWTWIATRGEVTEAARYIRYKKKVRSFTLRRDAIVIGVSFVPTREMELFSILEIVPKHLRERPHLSIDSRKWHGTMLVFLDRAS